MGAPARVQPGFEITEFTVRHLAAPRAIEWQRAYPNSGRPPTQQLSVRFEPSGAGTRVTLTFATSTPADSRRRTSAWLVRPLARWWALLVARMHLLQIADRLARAIRR